jgi:hypothetical protein
MIVSDHSLPAKVFSNCIKKSERRKPGGQSYKTFQSSIVSQSKLACLSHLPESNVSSKADLTVKSTLDRLLHRGINNGSQSCILLSQRTHDTQHKTLCIKTLTVYSVYIYTHHNVNQYNEIQHIDTR